MRPANRYDSSAHTSNSGAKLEVFQKEGGWPDLFSYVLLKVLVRSDIDADASILQPGRLNLVRRARHRRNNHI